MKTSELENKLRKHAEITKSVMQPPFDFKEEINYMEVYTMKKPKSIMKRTLAIVAMLALCVITVTMTPLANTIEGFFSDIVRFDGAITGTRYENATNEIKVSAMEIVKEDGDTVVPLELTFEKPNDAPFRCIEEISVDEYILVDSKTGEVLEVNCYPEYAGKGTVKGDKALIYLPVNNVKIKPDTEYTLLIEKMYGLSKADAPLEIIGNWECKVK